MSVDTKKVKLDAIRVCRPPSLDRFSFYSVSAFVLMPRKHDGYETMDKFRHERAMRREKRVLLQLRESDAFRRPEEV